MKQWKLVHPLEMTSPNPRYVSNIRLIIIANLGGKVRAFPALFANICGKSAIFACQTTRKLRVIHAPPRAMIVRAMHVLTGVKNIEFSVLHMALTELAWHREGEIYCEVRMVRERRSPGVEEAQNGMPIARVRDVHTSALFHRVQHKLYANPGKQ